jgi:hypothetical protein
MNPFKKLFTRSVKHEPGKWSSMLADSDLLRARDEIAEFHRIANAEAKTQGGSICFKNEYVVAWTAFRDNPNIETASVLLNIAPQLLPYFDGLSPDC